MKTVRKIKRFVKSVNRNLYLQLPIHKFLAPESISFQASKCPVYKHSQHFQAGIWKGKKFVKSINRKHYLQLHIEKFVALENISFWASKCPVHKHNQHFPAEIWKVHPNMKNRCSISLKNERFGKISKVITKFENCCENL